MTHTSQTSEEYSHTPPIATIRGVAINEIPKDLYIPPDAMAVFLETFEGPLDLLLYLIKKQNLDILDIPIAQITQQYMEYVELMKEFSLELAAEYLLMAALLAEIKSRMLLPRPVMIEKNDEDPRAELIRRLQEYEQIKYAAEQLNQLPQQNHDFFISTTQTDYLDFTPPQPTVTLQDLISAFTEVVKRIHVHASHNIFQDPLSVRERMADILFHLSTDTFMPFEHFFSLKEGRQGVVVTFLAMLELLKENLIQFVQAEAFSPIHLKKI